MSTSSKQPEPPFPADRVPAIAVIGSQRDIDALGPLTAAYRHNGIAEVPVVVAGIPTLSELIERAEHVDAILLVYPRQRSPNTVVPWPAAVTASGRRVPIGLVPAQRGSLEQFAAAAARVHGRRRHGHPEASIALLAQRSTRYIDLAGRIRRLLTSGQRPAESTFWWPADEIIRDDVTRGLGHGLAAALYVGHGRPSGWVGYAGIRDHHLADVDDACGVIISLACQTLSRRRIGLSFGEALVAQGSAAATIGAVSVTNHIANARWSLRLADALINGASTAGELLAAAEPDIGVGRCYRLIGDPMAPLLDAPGARAAARALTDDVVYQSEPAEVLL